ncbi:MAG: ABC transporter permease [Lentisphaeria bacterium]
MIRRLGLLLLTVLLLFLVWGPLVALVQSAFWVDKTVVAVDGETELQTEKEFDLTSVKKTLGHRRTPEVALNTIKLGVTTTAFCLLIGVPLAYLLARFRLPWSSGLHLMLILPFIMPAVICTFAWMLLLGGAGVISKGLAASTGIEIELYGFWGIVFVQSVRLTPYVFILIYAALRIIPDTISESTRIHGIPPWRGVLRVVLPLILPAIFGAGLLVFMSSIEEISGPAFLGGKFRVLSFEIYRSLKLLNKIDRAMVQAGILLVITLIPLLASYWLTRQQGRREVISGRGERSTKRELGLWKWPALILLALYIIVTVVLPFGVLIATSLMHNLGDGYTMSNLSLEWYRWVLSWKEVRAAIWHSTLYATLAATFATFVLGLFISYRVVRGSGRSRILYDFSGSVPLALPGAILGIGIYTLWLELYSPLTLTMWVLVMAYSVRFLPYAVRSGVAALEQVSKCVEEAAQIHGVSQLRAIKDIVLPLILPSLAGAWILVFVSAFRELTASLMLVSGETQVNATLLFDFIDNGNYLRAAAHSVVIMTVCIIGISLVHRFTTRSAADS